MSLLTRGLGSNLLLTGGMGGATVVIIKTPQDDTVAGASTIEGLYSKKRVKGMTFKSEDRLLLVDSITAVTESSTMISKILKLTRKDAMLIKTKVELMQADKCQFATMVIRKPSSGLVIKEHYMNKLDSNLNIQGDRLINFIEKQITISEKRIDKKEKVTKHLNVVDTLDNLEVIELMNIIKDMDDADV